MKINAKNTAAEKDGKIINLTNFTSIGIEREYISFRYDHNMKVISYASNEDARTAYDHLMDRLGFKMD